jgi:DNA-binding HxlR family transcriptional regulator
MRGYLRDLTKLGVVERRQQIDASGSIDYQLGPAAGGLIEVAEILRRWLADAPDEPLELGEPAAKSFVKALVDGWSTAIIRALAARPLTLTELNKVITRVSYPSLERRLAAMRMAGQIAACSDSRRGTPYAATEWLRRAVAPLLAAARWERKFAAAEAAPLARIDFEAAFLLGAPLLNLPEDLSGRCRLAVVPNTEAAAVGSMICVEDGQVVSCVSKLSGDASAWAAGSPAAWTSAIVDGQADRLEVGGDCEVARAVVADLHGSLFRSPQSGERRARISLPG